MYLFHTIAWRIASVSTASSLTILLLLGLKNDNVSLDHNSFRHSHKGYRTGRSEMISSRLRSMIPFRKIYGLNKEVWCVRVVVDKVS